MRRRRPETPGWIEDLWSGLKLMMVLAVFGVIVIVLGFFWVMVEIAKAVG